MGQYYTAKRTRNIYSPGSDQSFWLSRTKLDDFIRCPRCFYLDRRLGVGVPPGYPFSLNSAVDFLLKKEFDYFRKIGEPHPLMKEAGLDATPYAHKDIEKWRDNKSGIYIDHKPTNFHFFGAIDDVWQQKDGSLIIVDYKATSKDGEVSLEADWQDGYKRQMEIYQWLFRANLFDVAKTGYFVYCNGIRDKDFFDKKLDFSIKVIPYIGDDSWVEKKLLAAKCCLDSDKLPPKTESCDFCSYREASLNALRVLKTS